MSNKVFSTVRGSRCRTTKLNSAGTPVTDAAGAIVTDGFISVGYAPVIKEGEEIEVVNASGGLCVSDKSKNTLRWYDVKIELCAVNPKLLNLLTGSEIVTDADANDVGFRVAEAIGTGNFGFEVWTDLPVPLDGATQHGYFLVPYVKDGVIDEFTIQNGALTMTVNARTAKGSGWGVGPWNVTKDSLDADSKLLSAIGATDHLHMQVTKVAPPAASADPVAVTFP